MAKTSLKTLLVITFPKYTRVTPILHISDVIGENLAIWSMKEAFRLTANTFPKCIAAGSKSRAGEVNIFHKERLSD
jgi:hypothetical protein